MSKCLYKPLIFLFFATMCMAADCRKHNSIANSFTEKINLYPEQKIYHLGDTIWLQHLNTANTLYESNSNQYFSVDTLSIQFGPHCSTVYKLPEDSSNTFCNFIFNGVNAGPYFIHTFGCTNGGSFNFKVGMVLNKTGTFSIDLLDSRPVTACNFPNPNAGMGFPPSYIRYNFNIADGNKDIYLGITPARRNIPKDPAYTMIENKEIFFFKVE